MSGRLVEEVLDCAPEDVRGALLVVLLALAASARDSDRIARYDCSVADLSRRCRLAPGSVRNALAELRQRCLVEPLLDAAPGRHQEYRIAPLRPEHRRANVSSGGDVTPGLRVIGG